MMLPTWRMVEESAQDARRHQRFVIRDHHTNPPTIVLNLIFYRDTWSTSGYFKVVSCQWYPSQKWNFTWVTSMHLGGIFIVNNTRSADQSWDCSAQTALFWGCSRYLSPSLGDSAWRSLVGHWMSTPLNQSSSPLVYGFAVASNDVQKRAALKSVQLAKRGRAQF